MINQFGLYWFFEQTVRFILKFSLSGSVCIKIFSIRFGLYYNLLYPVWFVLKFSLFGSVCIKIFPCNGLRVDANR